MRSTYKVYLRWHNDVGSTDGAFTASQTYEASSHEDAAKERIKNLGNPEHYIDMAVVGRGGVRIFKIKPNVTITLEEDRAGA